MSVDEAYAIFSRRVWEETGKQPDAFVGRYSQDLYLRLLPDADADRVDQCAPVPLSAMFDALLDAAGDAAGEPEAEYRRRLAFFAFLRWNDVMLPEDGYEDVLRVVLESVFLGRDAPDGTWFEELFGVNHGLRDVQRDPMLGRVARDALYIAYSDELTPAMRVMREVGGPSASSAADGVRRLRDWAAAKAAVGDAVGDGGRSLESAVLDLTGELEAAREGVRPADGESLVDACKRAAGDAAELREVKAAMRESGLDPDHAAASIRLRPAAAPREVAEAEERFYGRAE